MVVKINPPVPSCANAVKYNESKVAAGKAEMLFSTNIHDPRNPMATFSQYERGSNRCVKMSFHACISPSSTDNMTDAQIVEIAKRLMTGLGYGNQPYILYRHNDIERVHYHIVSVRVDKNGRKIPDRLEGKRCNKLLRQMEKEFGFKVGNGEVKKEKQQPEQQKQPKREDVIDSRVAEFGEAKGFSKEAGDYSGQIEKIAKYAMEYNFTTEAQFRMIMESMNVRVGYEKYRGVEYMTFMGIDRKTGKNCTAPISGRKLNVPSFEELHKHMESSKGKVLRREKSRVGNIAFSLLPYAKSERHFGRMMEKKGISVYFSKSSDGRIYGVTFIDHHNKCCFKASDLPKISAALFEDARQNKWVMPGAETKAQEDGNDMGDVALDMAISAIGSEKSRQSDDEAAIRRGRKGP